MKNRHKSGLIILCPQQVEFADRMLPSAMSSKAAPPRCIDDPLLAQGISVPIFRGERHRLPVNY
jgi:hypothetical protein